MRFIWITIVVLLGLIMFVVVKQHFMWSMPYMVIHLSIIAFLRHRGLLEFKLPLFIIPAIFLTLQLLYSLYMFVEINSLNLEDEEYWKQIKYNFIRMGLLVVEYPLLVEFFKKPKFNRY